MARHLRMGMFDDGVRDRLFRYAIVQPNDCWEWIGLKNEAGYGVLRISGHSPNGWCERAHRIAFTLFKGDVPPDRLVLHRCDNRACVNPEHLFLGTHQDNTDDMHAKGRWRMPRPRRGSLNNKAKLTETEVLVIIDRLLAGETRTAIAVDFNVTIGAISRIAVGKNWRHLTVGRGIVKSTRGVKRG